MKVEYADISLLGAREENQDRVTAAVAEHAALLLVVDGMGGHADGARAAEVAQRVLVESFWHTPQPLFDPLGFLHMTLGRAHERPADNCASISSIERPLVSIPKNRKTRAAWPYQKARNNSAGNSAAGTTLGWT